MIQQCTTDSTKSSIMKTKLSLSLANGRKNEEDANQSAIQYYSAVCILRETNNSAILVQES